VRAPYAAPDGSYTATYPSPRRRLAAGAIDWALAVVLFLLGSIVGGVFQLAGLVSWNAGDLRGIPGSVLILVSQLIAAGPVVAYFAYYWTTGSTLGMRALDFELVGEGTGLPPGWARALLRALLAFVLAVAVNNVYIVVASDPLDGYSRLEQAAVDISLVLVASALVAKAWLVVDERRRSLVDRAFGLVYLEELVFAETGPWPWPAKPRSAK
jgi:hypothetical protein